MSKNEDGSITVFGKESEELEIFAGSVGDGGESLNFVVNMADDGNPELEEIVTIEEVLEYCKRHEKVMFFIAENNPQQAIQDVSEFFIWLVKGGADILLR